MTDFGGLAKAQKEVATRSIPPFATVVEVQEGKGVKIRIDGKPEAREIYYNSLVKVAPGDRVRIEEVGEPILIIGKLQY